MHRLSKVGFIDTRKSRALVSPRLPTVGLPDALREHEVLCTQDLAEATQGICGLVGRTTLTPSPTVAHPFQTTIHAVRIRDITLAHLDFHCPTLVAIHRTGPHYAVHSPVAGVMSVQLLSAPVEITPDRILMTNPGDTLRVSCGVGATQVILRIEQDALERTITRLLGRAPSGPTVFEPILDLTAPAAVRWREVMHLLFAELLTPGSLLHGGSGAGPLEDFVLSTLALVQASNHLRSGTSRPRYRRRTVQRATAYIDANLGSPISLADLAGAAQSSVRAIHQGFRDDLDTTPMAYVRDRRLERVRAELADSVPGDRVSVTRTAQQWGFGHLGNFSMAYRRRFGETPSQTVRR